MVPQTASGEFRQYWQPLAGAFIGIGCGVAALFFYSQGVFIKPLQTEFHWTRATLSLALLVAGGCAAVMAPIVGALSDRFGVRLVGCVSLLGLSLGFVALSRADARFFTYVAAIALLATCGAGSAPVVFSRVVNVTFDRAKGLALGIAAASTGIAAILLPGFLGGYVAAHGWRSGMHLLAVVPLVAIPFVWLLVPARRSASEALETPAVMAGIGFAEARATRRFWQMAAAFMLVSLASGGFIVHFVPLLSDAGLTPPQAGRTAGLIGFAVVAGRLGTGALIDRVFAPLAAAVLFTIAAVGCVLLAISGPPVAAVSAVMVGFAFGAEVDLVAYLAARYFGLRQIGAIYGLLYGCFTAGAAIGPLVTGALHDRFASYHSALLVNALLLLAAAALVVTLGAFPAAYRVRER